jgi:hypothetical protein
VDRQVTSPFEVSRHWQSQTPQGVTNDEKISINTHDMDGKWEIQSDELRQHPAYEEAEWITCEILSETISPQQLERFLSFRDDLQKINASSVNFFNAILGGSGNEDNANHIDALVMLVFLSLLRGENKENPGWMEILAEQLADIQFGPCAQGRTTRLAQVCMCLVSFS